MLWNKHTFCINDPLCREPQVLRFEFGVIKNRVNWPNMCLMFCWLATDGNSWTCSYLNTLRPRQNGRHFPDDSFKWIFLNENVWILINISLKFVPRGPINNIPTLVQIMAWRWPGDKPLSEPMMVTLLTHICVTRPQWVKQHAWSIWHHEYFIWSCYMLDFLFNDKYITSHL